MATYKDKWGAIYGDSQKKIYYMNGIGSNEEYWHVVPQEKDSSNIRRHYNMEGYELIESFMGAWHVFTPIHAQDYMDDNDHVCTLLIDLLTKYLLHINKLH